MHRALNQDGSKMDVHYDGDGNPVYGKPGPEAEAAEKAAAAKAKKPQKPEKEEEK